MPFDTKYQISWVREQVVTRKEIRDLFETDDFALGYCHPLWVELLADATSSRSAYILAHRGSELVGALPTTQRKISGLPVPVYESLSHDCYCFPFLSPNLDQSERQEVASMLLLELVRKGLLVRFFPPAWYELDFNPIVQKTKKKLTHRVDEVIVKSLKDLRGSGDLLASYSKHHRRHVQISLKSDLLFEAAKHKEEFEEFYDLVVETMQRAGKGAKFPLRTVVEGGQKLVERGLGTLFTAKQAGVILAGAFIVWSRRSGFYWLGASSRGGTAAKFSPFHGVMHSALCDAVQRGIDTFELGFWVNPRIARL